MTARIALVVVLAAGAACVEPKQYEGPIPIVPGAAARAMDIMKRGAPPDAGVPAAQASVHVMAAGEELGGTKATGRPGDLVLSNAEVVFVVNQLGAPLGAAASGGNLVDAADAHGKKDELGQIWTSFGGPARQAVYTDMTSGTAAGGKAWIEVSGHVQGEEKLRVVTRYTLAASDRALLIKASLENKSDHPIDKLLIGDAIAWGTTETFAPSQSLAFRGPSKGAYLGGIGRFVSYAIASTDGDIEATTGATRSETKLTAETTLAPGDGTDVSRVVAVGKRGDTASVVAELTQMAGESVGELAIDLVGDDGKPVKTPAGAKVAFTSARGEEIVAMRAATEGEPLGGELPPGLYSVAYASGGGRRASGAKVTVDVDAGKVAHATLHVSAAGSFEAKCSEIDPTRPQLSAVTRPMPCALTIEPIDGSPIDLGPVYLAGPARNRTMTSTGTALVPLAPGRYRVTASRGPEYASRSEEVVVTPTATAHASFLLNRLLDTAGYVATSEVSSDDSPLTARERLVADAADGIEIEIGGDHAPLVKELALSPFVVALRSADLGGDASAKPWGRVNDFPIPFDLLELTSFGDVAKRERVVATYLAALGAGALVTPTAQSNMAAFAREDEPRTFVRVADDASLEPWGAARSADLVNGLEGRRDVVVSNGPFLRVSANGVAPGGIAKGHDVVVKVHVECAGAACVESVLLLRARGKAQSQSVKLAALPSTARGADIVFRVHAGQDDAFVVVALGSAGIDVWAMTSAVFIDADGDGKALGR